MNANEAIRAIMGETGHTTATLRTALGMEPKKSNVLISRLNQDNMSVSVLNEMLTAMGYMLIAVPTNEKISKKAIRIDYKETEKGAARKKAMREYNKNSKGEQTDGQPQDVLKKD